MGKSLAVVGAGISGLTTAFLLRNKAYDITIYAKAFSPDITSSRAAAFWFPYHIRNDRRGVEWCNTSYVYYQELAKGPETGISMRRLIKVLRRGVEDEEPVWKDFMPPGSFRTMEEKELAKDVAIGYDIQVPLVETQLFLPWLQQQLLRSGVTFVNKEIRTLKALADTNDIVINCTGLGARELCDDHLMIPVRGQVGLLSPISNMNIYLDNEKPLYIVPRKDAIVIGGTYEKGIETETTEQATIKNLLDNAYEVFPQLKKQAVIGSWAGLRPYRPDVRVERDGIDNIIHNYGHGGSGFTIAFGCAEEVADLVDDIN